MKAIRSALVFGLVSAMTLAYTGCISQGRGRAGNESSDHEGARGGNSGGSSQGSNNAIATAPELWIHGCPSSPQLVSRMGSVGGRGIYNVRRLSGAEAAQLFRNYKANNLGFVMTLRWEDRDDSRLDVPPTPQESRSRMDELVRIVSMTDAAALGDGKLWVQFYNEITSGPGHFRPQDADAMFAWATETADRIRREAPYIRIVSPALTGADAASLANDPATLTGNPKLRCEVSNRIIDWAVAHADAVDVHLHVDSGARAAEYLANVREALDKRTGGSRIKIVSWEWSPAKYANHDDKAGARQVLIDVWSAMAEAGVVAAAYSAYWPAANGDIFKWAMLSNSDSTPNEPFYSTVKDIAEGKIKPGDGSSSGTAGAGEKSQPTGGEVRKKKGAGRRRNRDG